MAARRALLVGFGLLALLLSGCSQQPTGSAQSVTQTATPTYDGFPPSSGAATNRAPSMGVSSDDTARRITITTADSGIDWSQFNVKAAKGLMFKLDGDATQAGGTHVSAGAAVAAGPSTAAVMAGDFLAFCGEDAGGPAGAAESQVAIQLIHVPTNTLVYQHTFASLAACA